MSHESLTNILMVHFKITWVRTKNFSFVGHIIKPAILYIVISKRSREQKRAEERKAANESFQVLEDSGSGANVGLGPSSSQVWEEYVP